MRRNKRVTKSRKYWYLGSATGLAILLACWLAWPTHLLPTMTIAVDAAGRVSKSESQPNVFPTSDLTFETGKGELILLDLTATQGCWIDVQGLHGVTVLCNGSPHGTTVVGGKTRVQLASGSYRLTIKGTRG